MANEIVVQGTPIVFNNVLLSVDGSTETTEINGYIKSIGWSTGTQSENVKTITTDGNPITNNVVVCDPTVNISFAPGAWVNFYAFLNNKYSQFTLQLTQYQTGNLAGAQQNVLIQNARINQNTGGTEASNAANPSSVSFVATSAGYI